MSELTLTIMRLGLLALLWLFVFSLATVLRSDLYGTRVVNRVPRPHRRQRKDHGSTAQTDKPSAGRSALNRASAAAGSRRGKRTATHLVVTSGPLTGTNLPLKESGILIGRNPECTLVLDDDYASGRHARVQHSGSGWVVEDLNSTNGTYVGGQRVSGSVPVEAGSSLRIGTSVIELRN